MALSSLALDHRRPVEVGNIVTRPGPAIGAINQQDLRFGFFLFKNICANNVGGVIPRDHPLTHMAMTSASPTEPNFRTVGLLWSTATTTSIRAGMRGGHQDCFSTLLNHSVTQRRTGGDLMRPMTAAGAAGAAVENPVGTTLHLCHHTSANENRVPMSVQSLRHSQQNTGSGLSRRQHGLVHIGHAIDTPVTVELGQIRSTQLRSAASLGLGWIRSLARLQGFYLAQMPHGCTYNAGNARA